MRSAARFWPSQPTAAKVVTLVGSDSVMGLALGKEGKLYGTDFTQNPGLYRIDINTGFGTAIAALPFGFSSSLVVVNPHSDLEKGSHD